MNASAKIISTWPGTWSNRLNADFQSKRVDHNKSVFMVLNEMLSFGAKCRVFTRTIDKPSEGKLVAIS